MSETPTPKKVTWIELYFDLVFVFAVARVAHVVAAGPGWRAVWIGLGLFAVLWWTWIGFAVFYNRYGDETSRTQRLLVLAGTIPCGLAAVAVDDMAHGSRTAFTLSMVAVRLLLAAAHYVYPGKISSRVATGYVLSAIGFAASIFVGSPWWFVIWAAMIIAESGAAFAAPRNYKRLSKQELYTDWRKSLALMRPTNREYALEGGHLAERFGLFIIIVLGEVVASSGTGALEGGDIPWLTLAGAIALSGVLWWIYFDASAVLQERLLAISGGSPEIARSSYATGLMVPAFGLIMVAAGLRQLIDGQAGSMAFWLVSVGTGSYLVFNRIDGNLSPGWWLRFATVAATFLLGLLYPLMPPQIYVWVVFGWTVVCAVAVSIGSHRARAMMETPAS